MRIRGVFRRADYPGDPAEVDALFAAPPGAAEVVFDRAHSGMAFAAHSPELALQLGKLSRFLALGTGWAKRTDLRELAIQTVNRTLNSTFSFEARLPNAKAAGVSADQLAALTAWRESDLFDGEQKLVIEYSAAVVKGDVPAELFARVVAHWGERGTVEFTAIVGVWAMWAMMLNAAGATFGDEPV